MDEFFNGSISSISQQKNPWIDEKCVGSAKNVLLLAETTGHISKERSLELENVTQELYETSPSLKMIKLQREIKSNRRKLEQFNLEARQHFQNNDTRDVTHLEILAQIMEKMLEKLPDSSVSSLSELVNVRKDIQSPKIRSNIPMDRQLPYEERLEKMKELNSHLESIVNKKDLLISRLQQPFVDDFIRIDANYQEHATEAITHLVPTLSDLTVQMGNIDWASRMDLKDGQLDGLLNDIAGTLGSQQALYQYTTKLRQNMDRILRLSAVSSDPRPFNLHSKYSILEL